MSVGEFPKWKVLIYMVSCIKYVQKAKQNSGMGNSWSMK